MASFFRETAFGATIRLITRKKIFAHVEDQAGFVFPPNHELANTSTRSSDTHVGEQSSDSLKEKHVRDQADNLVTWYGDNDPSNPQTWSTARKFYATGLLGLYTTSVYVRFLAPTRAHPRRSARPSTRPASRSSCKISTLACTPPRSALHSSSSVRSGTQAS